MVTLRAAYGFIGATLTATPFMSSLYALIGSYFSVHRRPSSNMTLFPKLTYVTYVDCPEVDRISYTNVCRAQPQRNKKFTVSYAELPAPWNIVILDKLVAIQEDLSTNVHPSLSGPTLNQMNSVRASNSLPLRFILIVPSHILPSLQNNLLHNFVCIFHLHALPSNRIM